MKEKVKNIAIFTVGAIIFPFITAMIITHFIDNLPREVLLDSAKDFIDNINREISYISLKLFVLTYIAYPRFVTEKYRAKNKYLNLLYFILFYILVCLIYFVI